MFYVVTPALFSGNSSRVYCNAYTRSVKEYLVCRFSETRVRMFVKKISINIRNNLSEYYCGKNVYIFISELYSDIYNMGRGLTPYCKGRAFHFIGFVHFLDEKRYFLEEDPNVVFEMDNYIHGLECHLGICIFRCVP